MKRTPKIYRYYPDQYDEPYYDDESILSETLSLKQELNRTKINRDQKRIYQSRFK